MSLILRVVGWAAALASVATVSMAVLLWFEGRNLQKSWGQFWFDLHPASLNLTQSIVQRFVSPDLWDTYAVAMLEWKAWQGIALVAGILLLLGIVFLLAGRRRRKPGQAFRH